MIANSTDPNPQKNLDRDKKLRLSARELLIPLLVGGSAVGYHAVLVFLENRGSENRIDLSRDIISAIAVLTLAIFIYLFEMYSAMRKMAIEDSTSITEALTKNHDDLASRFRQDFNTHILGPAENNLREIMAMTRNAVVVRNTFIWFNVGESRFLEDCWGVEQLNESRAVTKEWLSTARDPAAKWIDLVSDPVLRSPKINWLGFWESLTDAERSKYRLHRLNINYPIINFMLLDYGAQDLPSKVIFGWGHHPHDVAGNVFESEDSRLIETFSAYWQTLVDDSHEFSEDNRPVVVTAPDISGIWYRLAFEVAEDWRPGNDIRGDASPKNVALVEIGENSERTIKVSGAIFSFEDHDKVRVFNSVATDLAKFKEGPIESWRLYFSTEGDNRRLLAGFYQFASSRGPIDEFVGEHHDAAIGAKKKLAIVGRRLSPEWLSTSVMPESVQDALNDPGKLLKEAYKQFFLRGLYAKRFKKSLGWLI